MKNWFGLNKILILLVLSMACTNKPLPPANSIPYYQDAAFTPLWLHSNSDSLKGDFHRIPSFRLTNQNGETITEKTMDGHIVVADFFFTTCPGICPTMTKNMHLVQERFLNDDKVLIFSHSVTPAKDSVTVLKKYAQEKNILDNKWHLLTGDKSTIYTLGRKAYFAEEDMGLQYTDDDFLHTENFVLIDQNRRLRGIYNGLNSTSVHQLIEDIEELQKEE